MNRTPEQAAEPPPRADEDARPATIGDLRALRRWLLVAGVWAVAASAIALIALLEARTDGDDDRAADTAAQLTRAQRQLDARIDDLDGRIEDLPRSEDVSRLEDRLKEVEDGASATSDRLERLRGDIDDLQRQVEQLEQQGGGAGTDTTATATTP